MNYIDKAATWFLSKVSNSFVISEYYKRTSGKKIEWKRQATVMSKKEIKDWKNGLMEATDPDNPRRGALMRFYENMKLDGHLMSCVENRIIPVQFAPFKLTDKNGAEDTEAKKLLEKPWYLEMVKIICSHTFEGTKLVCMYELDENGELKEVEEVPQSNFVPQKGIVVMEEYDTEGINYKEGAYKNYYFQVGGDWNLGIFSGLAMAVIAKKLGLGSWMSYIDKFGVPPIFFITDRMDTNRRDELFEMGENFRQNMFAVLQGSEKIEIPSNYQLDAHNTFKALMTEICDKEISKRILGSVGMTDEKSFVGAAQVQERIMKYREKVDKLMFRYYFNSEVKPRLVKLSPVYAPLANLSFEYDESETLSIKELLEAIKGLSQYFEFDIEELKKITGLPITKLRAAIGITPPEPEPANAQKKKNRPDNRLGAGFIRPPFKPNAFSQGMPLIYAASWESAIDKLIEEIRSGKLDANELDKDFLLKTYDRLNKAAQNGYGKDYYTDEIARKMRENLLQFAATKTHVQQKEVQLLSDSIDEKPLYKQEAKKYMDLQNGTYLDVQTAWAARSAQAGRQYGEFQRDKDIYPRLKFRTMSDDNVRPAHAVLEGMVLDVDDPNLDTYMPPLDPRCRCRLEQTREQATALPDYEPDPQWAGNPGKTGIIFNSKNSYNEKVENKKTRLEIRRQTELAKEYMPYNHIIQVGDNKVYVNDFADTSDMKENISAAKKIAEALKKEIYIRPHVDGGVAIGYKNPELGIGSPTTKGDLKTYQGTGKFDNFIKGRVRSANKQGASFAVLDISLQKDLTGIDYLLREALSDENINKKIKRIILIKGDNVAEITRKQIIKLDFSPLERLKNKNE